VNKHILLNGMDNSYTRWIHHGERLDVDVIEYLDDVHDNDDDDDFRHDEGMTEDYSADRLDGMLADLHTATEQAREDGQNLDRGDQDGDAEPHDKESFFANVMKEAKRELYPGCTESKRNQTRE
jgi:hypothetical protein